ncbi:uncharacterized protein LOC120138712 [Hibiscus syriacus]|uniref:uncharacterized protein LOC120138712 n=1 Tax=Hibiscus syriacus TaxID=106335 RepID=UPI001924E12F|nr:uncharacterized protein LOC120138712 [Hibiscus syriacus]
MAKTQNKLKRDSFFFYQRLTRERGVGESTLPPPRQERGTTVCHRCPFNVKLQGKVRLDAKSTDPALVSSRYTPSFTKRSNTVRFSHPPISSSDSWIDSILKYVGPLTRAHLRTVRIYCPITRDAVVEDPTERGTTVSHRCPFNVKLQGKVRLDAKSTDPALVSSRNTPSFTKRSKTVRFSHPPISSSDSWIDSILKYVGPLTRAHLRTVRIYCPITRVTVIEDPTVAGENDGSGGDGDNY